MSHRRRALWVALGVALAACTPAPSWQQVSLAGDPMVLVALVDGVLVGTHTQAGPALTHVADDGGKTILTVTARSGYGAEGRWTSLAAAGTDLVAIAAARGGAHANIRWSVWRGTPTTGLVELPQTFETFGGWGAGTLTGIAFADSSPFDGSPAPASAGNPDERPEPVIVGSWQAPVNGLEPALWLPSEERWLRRDPAGTPLANTPTSINRVSGVATRLSGLVLAGSTISLGAELSTTPGVWLQDARWRRIALPHRDGSGATADAVACGASLCLVVGHAGTTLLTWRLVGSTVEQLPSPPVTLAAARPVPAPVMADDDCWLAVVTTDGPRVLRLQDRTWTATPGPPGTPAALAVTATSLWLIARSDDGAILWRQHR